MNESENIRSEIIRILVLIATLTLTSSNLSPELLEDKPLLEILPLISLNE